eukprot:CAMPEP_0168479412 /NCGR_PEP_ID=MMETSP0228-20121227/63458_1 /TAXON_ID=133427 /ORGANISM="Protoceratium reticulatum, Strain CCCM 535 (=CCMP 1889)" /LENGTH=65 /DNA_ID=CAMNT_0008495699 /DNA_START=78 /DNA_END=271 /DNA_ORIENTATION=-
MSGTTDRSSVSSSFADEGGKLNRWADLSRRESEASSTSRLPSAGDDALPLLTDGLPGTSSRTGSR